MTKIYNRRSFKKFRSSLRNNMTKAEKILWQQINRDKIGFRFRRQYGIGDYIIDFYCPALNLAVEVDGRSHQIEKVFVHDQVRQKYLEDQNIIVIRYTDEQIFNNLETVLIEIESTCKKIAVSHGSGNSPVPT